MDPTFIILALAAVFGIYMAWGIGANDVANAMAASVGARALTLKQAIIVAAIFEFAGAFLAGGKVTSTIRKGIIDAAPVADNPEILVFGMLAADKIPFVGYHMPFPGVGYVETGGEGMFRYVPHSYQLLMG